MRTIFFLLILFLSVNTKAQFNFQQKKIPIIDVDSLPCCKTVKGTAAGSISRPVIYSVQMHVDSVSGYPNFNWSVIASNNNLFWYSLKTGTITMANPNWEDGAWDTLIFDTTPFTILMLGVEIETIDSVQATEQRHDMIITEYK